MSHKLSKGSDGIETQMKRIWDSCEDVWGHNHKIIRTEQKHDLVEDHTSFEMKIMMTRTDQLVNIAKATSSKIYTRESEVGTCSLPKALVLSLKQFRAHFYRHYEKGTTRAMVGLQVLHSSNAFWHPSGIQMYWQAWALSCSACSVSNLEGTLRQLLPSSERCTTDQP